jgi:hypothetical protein
MPLETRLMPGCPSKDPLRDGHNQFLPHPAHWSISLCLRRPDSISPRDRGKRIPIFQPVNDRRAVTQYFVQSERPGIDTVLEQPFNNDLLTFIRSHVGGLTGYSLQRYSHPHVERIVFRAHARFIAIQQTRGLQSRHVLVHPAVIALQSPRQCANIPRRILVNVPQRLQSPRRQHPATTLKAAPLPIDRRFASHGADRQGGRR